MRTCRVELGPGLALETVAIELVALARRSGDTYQTWYRGVPLVVAPTTEVSEIINYGTEAFEATDLEPVSDLEP
jgi:hypothetical protein